MRKPPSYSDMHSGECEITIPYGSGTLWLRIDWGVEAENLDWKVLEAKTIRKDGSLLVHYTPEKVRDMSDYYLVLSTLREDHDKAIREAIWNEISPSILSLPESHYVA